MKSLLIGCLFILFGTASMAQQIVVEGNSELKVMPDEAVMLLSLQEHAMTTSEVTDALNKKAKTVSDALKKAGVKAYTFTADNYYVNVHRIYTRGSAKDSGYVASQQLRVVVKDINSELVKAMEAVQQAENIGFQLQFGLSDASKKSFEAALLKLALEDAKRKASLIAETMGISDYVVQQVDYTGGRPIQPVMYRAEAMMMSKSADDRSTPTISPDEQTLSDNVRVVFRFGKAVE